MQYIQDLFKYNLNRTNLTSFNVGDNSCLKQVSNNKKINTYDQNVFDIKSSKKVVYIKKYQYFDINDN